MNLSSCEGCGIVVDLKNVTMIEMLLPDDPEDNEKDGDGDYVTFDTHYNPNVVWDEGPLKTWCCPVCQHFNGVGAED